MSATAEPEKKSADHWLRQELLQAPGDAGLQELLLAARLLCSAASCLVALRKDDRALIYAHDGLNLSKLPQELPLASFIGSPDSLLVVEDVPGTGGPQFLPLFRSFQGMGFYACAPLLAGDGANFGLMAVMDPGPRSLDSGHRELLELLARQIAARLEQIARQQMMERELRANAQAERALTVERNFVNAALDTVGSLVLVLDTAGKIVRFNRTCEVISGYSFAELVGRPVWEKLVPPEESESVIRRFETIRNGSYPQVYEHSWRTRSGHRRHISWSATVMVGSNAAPEFIITTGTDITDRRTAEAVLRESEARYRQLIESSLGVVLTHDLRGNLLSINRHAARNLGYEPEQLLGRNLASLMPPERAEPFQDYIETISREGEEEGLSYICHRSGDVRTIAYRNRLIQVEGREPFVLSHGVDITTQTRTERQLQMLSRQSQSILESVADGIFSVDPEGRCTVINAAAAAMLGLTQQQAMGERLHEMIHHTAADGATLPISKCHIMQCLRTLKPIKVSNEIFWRKDSSSFPVEYTANPQLDEARHPVGIVVAFQDVTERQALDRMKDEFVSTVSHELRTPLTSLRAALGLVASGSLAGKPDKEKQMLDIAVNNSDRLTQLVNDILDLERIEAGKLLMHCLDCDVQLLLRRAADQMALASSRLDVRLEVAPTKERVWADPDRILQTLTNLIGNAIKFSPRGSVVRLFATPAEKGFIRLSVCDEGRGIPKDKKDVIFERFQQVDASDSRTMGGTGLGLAICRSIVVQHGGRIWVESQVSRGSCFHFTLPRNPPQR